VRDYEVSTSGKRENDHQGEDKTANWENTFGTPFFSTGKRKTLTTGKGKGEMGPASTTLLKGTLRRKERHLRREVPLRVPRKGKGGRGKRSHAKNLLEKKRRKTQRSPSDKKGEKDP